jgi:hypothetical protein
LQKGDETRQRAIAIILRDYEANPFLLEHSVPGSGYQDEVDRDSWWALRTSQCQNCVDVSLPFLVADATGKNQFTRVSFLVDMSQQAVVSITMPTRQLLRAKNDRVKTPKIETVSLMLSSKRATQLMAYLGGLLSSEIVSQAFVGARLVKGVQSSACVTREDLWMELFVLRSGDELRTLPCHRLLAQNQSHAIFPRSVLAAEGHLLARSLLATKRTSVLSRLGKLGTRRLISEGRSTSGIVRRFALWRTGVMGLWPVNSCRLA